MCPRGLSVLLAVSSIFGQSVSGTIAGVVTDPKGAVVPGARVAARNAATNARSVQTTGEDGFYRLTNLVPGEYVVVVEREGFRKASLSPQQLGAADALRLDVTLEIGQVTDSVTVS